MAIMVNLNQGWRMAGDTRRRWTVAARRSPSSSPTTMSCGWRNRWPARTLAGLAALRASRTGVRIAGGEMTRTFKEVVAALDVDAFDVHQPDVVLAGGMLRGRAIAELALARDRWFTPHTWSNGIGLLANLARHGGCRWRTPSSSSRTTAGLDPRAAGFILAEPIGRSRTVSCASRPRPGSGRHGRGRGPPVRRVTRPAVPRLA